ncbi:MAG TPA: DUF4183 domain-containing protein [Clostridiales bacterium]|nr:DUF4183 domain-containing protein [Clostridiales bacterium]
MFREGIGNKQADSFFGKSMNTNAEKKLLKADVYHYNAISDGEKMTYTNEDELKEYGSRGILDPNQVSYYNLFINGVLQPKVNYKLQEGQLVLNTESPPIEGSMITLVFVTFREGESVNTLNSAYAEGFIPTGIVVSEQVTDNGVETKDYIYPNLQTEIMFFGPRQLISGREGSWQLTVGLANNGEYTLTNLRVSTSLLLDSLSNIEGLSVSRGELIISNHLVFWDIAELEPGESVQASFSVTGIFYAAGIRSLCSSFARGTGAIGEITSPAVSGEYIEVGTGLGISSTIISGPTKIVRGAAATWQVELRLTNQSSFRIEELMLTDVILLKAPQVNVRSLTKGSFTINDQKLLWQPGRLEPGETVVLLMDLTGSFDKSGLTSLNIGQAEGRLGDDRVTTPEAQDFLIMVLPSHTPVSTEFIKADIAITPIIAALGVTKDWNIRLSITNLSAESMTEVIVSTYILLDDIAGIEHTSLPSGELTLGHDVIIWNIPELLPGQALTAGLTVTGSFNARGLRPLCRVLAAGWLGNTCILSSAVSGSLIRVTDYDAACIIVDKVFSQYQCRACFTDIDLPQPYDSYERIIFRPGYIVENMPEITRLKNYPKLCRVRFSVRIPFEAVGMDKSCYKGFLPDIKKDIVMYMPPMPDEFIYRIVVDTRSEVLEAMSTGSNTFTAGVFMVIQAVGKVQLHVPAYSCPDPPLCREYRELSAYDEFMQRDIPELYPFSVSLPSPTVLPLPGRRAGQQNSFSGRASVHGEAFVPCPACFGELTITKHIISGPLVVRPGEEAVWILQLKVINEGYGPVSKVRLIDNLLIDEVSDFQLISLSQGTFSRNGSQLTWDIGTLPANQPLVLEFSVTGKFTASGGMLLKGVNNQYNAVSNGNTTYTNEDEILSYGSYGIPDPESVSFLNLYINGVLQPQVSYTVEEGTLTLNLDDPPIEGAPIILEAVLLWNSSNVLLKGESYQYNALAAPKATYTNADEITMYGNKGIQNPDQVSYHLLFINGVPQAPVSYRVEENLLKLETEDLPIPGAPMVLQLVTFYDEV